MDRHQEAMTKEEEKKKEAEAKIAELLENKTVQLKMLDDELAHCREQEKALRTEPNAGYVTPIPMDHDG